MFVALCVPCADAKPGNIQRTSQKPPQPQTFSGPSIPISTPPRACESIADVIASKANLQILHRAIKLAGLYNMLSDKLQSITLFAPTDNAFLALSKSASQLPILTDPAALKSILGYHALSKAVEFDDLRPGKDLSTNVWNDVGDNFCCSMHFDSIFCMSRLVNISQVQMNRFISHIFTESLTLVVLSSHYCILAAIVLISLQIT